MLNLSDYIPEVVSNSISFSRIEENGDYVIMLTNHPELSYVKLNNTAKLILDNCGKPLNEICMLIREAYNIDENNNIENDLINTMHLFWRYGIIKWKGNHPFQSVYEKEYDNFKMEYLIEDKAIADFTTCFEKYNCVYTNAYYDFNKEFSETVIRQKWIKGLESYIKLTRNEIPVALISVIPQFKIAAFDVNSIFFAENHAINSKEFISALEFTKSFYQNVFNSDFFQNGCTFYFYSKGSDSFKLEIKDLKINNNGVLLREIGEDNISVSTIFIE